MDRTYWHKQTLDKPLYGDLLWSRPENRALAGKLLIFGGNAQGFAAAAEAYALATKAGIGVARVLLPDVLQKTVGRVFEAGEYAPSTPSGSFAQTALNELLAMGNWADGTLLAGDLGRNSETAILLEKFLDKHLGPVTITKDAADYITKQPGLIQNRSDTILVISFSQLQKLATAMRFPTAFTFDMDLFHLIDALHGLTGSYPFAIVTKHLGMIFVAVNGEVSSTKLIDDQKVWRLKAAAYVSVWQLQNPSQPFEALTTAIIENMTNS